jgi:hypothetical protein
MQSELVMESSKEKATAVEVEKRRRRLVRGGALESSERKRQRLVARCERETGFAETARLQKLFRRQEGEVCTGGAGCTPWKRGRRSRLR